MLGSILNLLYPPRCPLCEKLQETRNLCNDCEGSLHGLDGDFTSPHLDHVWFNKARSCFAYEGQILEAIHKFKYSKQFNLLPMFQSHLAEEVQKMGNYDLIVPVPLHWLRLWKRGYNQSAVLARSIAKKLGVQVNVLALKKRQYIKPQVGLDRNARLKNVKDVFDVGSSQIKKLQGRKILLIDDVLTTGATVNECSKILIKQAHAGTVDVLTVARTI